MRFVPHRILRWLLVIEDNQIVPLIRDRQKTKTDTEAVFCFPGCRLIDIHEYLLEKGVKLEGVTGTRYLYHDPCHTPMKQQDPIKTVNALLATADGSTIAKSDRCCGEAGTLAIGRPDISTQVRFRKEEELKLGAGRLHADGYQGPVRVLTSCPSCLQGLQRYKDDIEGLDADYVVVEIARHVLGDNWMREYVDRANKGGIERVLV
jgi:Fe-S oxidoreductase